MSESPDGLMEAEPVEPLPFPAAARAAAIQWIVVGAVFGLVSFGGEVAVTRAASSAVCRRERTGIVRRCSAS